jgi:hypothetical protein
MYPSMAKRTLLALLLLWLTGCGGYELKNLAKSDIDLVTDEFIVETRALVRELTIKLYKRNPDQLTRGAVSTIEARLRQLMDNPGVLAFPELDNAQELAALELVFDPDFAGDRVFALVTGLGGMLRLAYGYNNETFILDSLDPALLATSARNTEILLWRLKNNRRKDGRPFLITAEYRGVIDNLSFERLFGKLIALQDMMARIASDADDRRVTKVVHTATSVFIPLPI